MNPIKFLLAFLFFSSLSVSLLSHSNHFKISMRDAPLIDAIRLIAHMQGKNIIVPNDIVGSVTLNFPSIHLAPALAAVLESKELGLIEKNGVTRVATMTSIEALGGDLKTITYPLKYSKAADMKSQVASLNSKRGSVMVDGRTNSITVRDSDFYQRNILTLIQNVDRADRQVLIEARIVEASTDFSRKLGTEWGLSYTQGTVTVDRSKPKIPDGLSIGIKPMDTLSLDIALSAAEEKGEINIISKPSIVTMNNRAANIRSGFKFYVRAPGNVNIGTEGGEAQASDSSSSNLQEISSGISMVVTPQITADDKISLSVDVTESQPDFSKAIEGIPTIADNAASTIVSLKDGETTVIGGLFQTQDSITKKGLPLLSSIPIFGPLLFGTQTKGKFKKELIIFINTQIVKNNKTTDKILESAELTTHDKKPELKKKPAKPIINRSLTKLDRVPVN
jgi:type IV pilus assembly protein PilQ